MQNFIILVYPSQPLFKEKKNSGLGFFNTLTKKLCRNADKAFLWAVSDPEIHQSMAKGQLRTRFIPFPFSLWLSTEVNDKGAGAQLRGLLQLWGKAGWHCGWTPHPFPWGEGAWQAHRWLLQKVTRSVHAYPTYFCTVFIDSKCFWASLSHS